MSEIPSFGQPDGKKVDSADPLARFFAGRVHSQFLRKVAPQLGMNASKLVLGDALSSIIGDDENSFGLKAATYNQAWAQQEKRHLLEQLDWEVGLPELPDAIRKNLGNVMNEISLLDWQQQAEFNCARRVWTKYAKNFTKHQIALHYELRGAIYYYLGMAQELSVPWQEYFFGSRQY